MHLRTKLALFFAAALATLLGLFAGVVYVTAATYRRNDYYQHLRQHALTKVRLLLRADVSPATLKLLSRNTPDPLFQEEVIVYDSAHRLLYHDDLGRCFVHAPGYLLDTIQRTGSVQLQQREWQIVGLPYHYQGQTYLIIAASYDEAGLAHLRRLRLVLGAVSLIGVGLVLLAGRLLARWALRPVAGIIEQVRELTASHLDRRVVTPNTQDELGQLGAAFNEMLNRLELSFQAQREFVSNVAHELRTPLAAVAGELELASRQRRPLEEYEQTVSRALSDTHRLTRLVNGLLDLAKASYDRTDIHFQPLRFDEVLMGACQQVTRLNPQYRIHIGFAEEPDEDRDLLVFGNEYLLTVAVANLLDNGCKYSSDQRVEALLLVRAGQCELRVTDHGLGIAAEDLPHLFTAFYRGGNRRYTSGTGIGLALAARIIQRHGGHIAVTSAVGAGSTFTIFLPTRPIIK
jgi:signal transduction histidine kinase